MFLEIRTKHYLPAVYAHLMSLAQTERLVKLQEGGQSLADGGNGKFLAPATETAK